MNEKIESILRMLNRDDELYWPLIMKAGQHHDPEILRLALLFKGWIDGVFNAVAELKKKGS